MSDHFLASSFISEVEVPQLLKAAQEEGVILLPVLLSPCAYNETELGPLQAVNNLRRPLRAMRPVERAAEWVKVAQLAMDALKASPVPQSAATPGIVTAHNINRPKDWLPLQPNPLFQERPGEFDELERLLFQQKQPARVGLVGVGVVGMGGVGKTYLAVEVATRYHERFPDGIFWMLATGTRSDWQHQLAELAKNTGYLPPDDDPGRPENEERRATHFTRYLAEHSKALLILDNVDTPDLVTSALPAIAGIPLTCALLYTSRKQELPSGFKKHTVDKLSEDAALRLMLEDIRPIVLTEALAEGQSDEAQAARNLCRKVDGLPLGLIHLRHLLSNQTLSIARLLQAVNEHGMMKLAGKKYGDARPLFVVFDLSWKQIKDWEAQRFFLLAGYFPEAAPIPLWLLGLAARLGESVDPWEPLGKTRDLLAEYSLVEVLDEGQIRLHPLVREFARLSEVQTPAQRRYLTDEAGESLAAKLANLNQLEARARRDGYERCLRQVQAALEYANLLGTQWQLQLANMERLLDQESNGLYRKSPWPELLPGLFFSQLYNRAVEEGQPPPRGKPPDCWVHQLAPVGAEDQHWPRTFTITHVAFSPDGGKVLTGWDDGVARLVEIAGASPPTEFFGGHNTKANHNKATHVAFSPNGRRILTGSADGTIRLWDTSGKCFRTLSGHEQEVTSLAFSPNGRRVLLGDSVHGTVRLLDAALGQQLTELSGHKRGVTCVAFSPDGRLILTGSMDRTARLWSAASGQPLATLESFGGYGGMTCVAFSPDMQLLLTGDAEGWVYFWSGVEGEYGHLMGAYLARHEIKAIQWQQELYYLLVADNGGDRNKPNVYRLRLEGRE